MLVLCCVVCLSYYINFVYNMGHLRVIYVVIWMLAFVISLTLVKMVAKIIFNFYNKFKQKISSNKKIEVESK